MEPSDNAALIHAMVTTRLSLLVVHCHKTLHTCIKPAFLHALHSRNALRTESCGDRPITLFYSQTFHYSTHLHSLRQLLHVYFLSLRRNTNSLPSEARSPLFSSHSRDIAMGSEGSLRLGSTQVSGIWFPSPVLVARTRSWRD